MKEEFRFPFSRFGKDLEWVIIKRKHFDKLLSKVFESKVVLKVNEKPTSDHYENG